MHKQVGITAMLAALIATQSMMQAQQSEVGKTEVTPEEDKTGQTRVEESPSKLEETKGQEQTTATTAKASKKKKGKGAAKSEANHPEEQKPQQQIDPMGTAKGGSKGQEAKNQPTKDPEPKPDNQSTFSTRKAAKPVGKTKEGRTIYEGSDGGHYYLDDNQERVHFKDSVGVKIVGKTASGKTIYEGPRGGHFYYNDHGSKVYVKKK